MSDARVIKATFAEWKMIKTRKVLQLILEVPLEQQGEVLTRLGPPIPDQEKWVAVALLDELVAAETEHQREAAKASRSLAGKERYANADAMEQARTRAVLLTKDPQFQMWAGYPRDEEKTKAFLYRACHVESRRDIATDPEACKEFLRLEGQYAEATGRLADGRR